MKKNNKGKNGAITILKDNWLFFLLFVAATAFFIYQHAISVSWDFATYVLNAKYWVANGSYFEILRPPLMPFLLGVFSILGWKASEFIFIILASALFAYSTYVLARSLKFHPGWMYAISLNFYVLHLGLINGTELLSLALLEISVAYIIANRSSSGLSLGLSALARYTSLALFPLLLFHLQWRKILRELVLFAVPVTIWFAYNFATTGNLFTSIADQYANNILYREYLIGPANFSHFLFSLNILLPFVIAGIILSLMHIIRAANYHFIRNTLQNNKSKSNWSSRIRDFTFSSRAQLIMLILLLFAINSYLGIPVKNSRYLFSIVLPVIYFAYVGIDFLSSHMLSAFKRNQAHLKRAKKVLYALAGFVLLATFMVAAAANSFDYDPKSSYLSVQEKLAGLGLENCSILSNSWTKLSYYETPAGPSPRQEILNQSVNEGNIVVLLTRESEPEYVFDSDFMSKQQILYQDEKMFILGSGNCRKSEDYNASYLGQIQDAYSRMYNETLNINPCIILLHSYSLAEKTCNFVNMNGFRLDDNRAYK